MIEEKDTAVFENGILTYTAHYYWPEIHSETLLFKMVEPLAQDCFYWCAIGGKCYGFTAGGNSCIANLTSALRLCGMPRNNDGWISDDIYVIWKPKTATPSVLKRWESKWSKRTAIRTHTAY